ncbi:MAG: AsmA family protein [Xanthomonadales bacterium]|nr:AsmA family protein [Xanthomonadales bacterium]
MIRKLIMAVVALVVLLVIAVVLVVVLVDPNDYRDQLSAKATEQLGRPVSLNGPLSLKVFPSIALDISDVEVGNPEGFPSDQPLAKVGSALASVQLGPLLSGQVLVGDIALNNV